MTLNNMIMKISQIFTKIIARRFFPEKTMRIKIHKNILSDDDKIELLDTYGTTRLYYLYSNIGLLFVSNCSQIKFLIDDVHQ